MLNDPTPLKNVVKWIVNISEYIAGPFYAFFFYIVLMLSREIGHILDSRDSLSKLPGVIFYKKLWKIIKSQFNHFLV